MSFILVNDDDANWTEPVEGETTEEAALNALEMLGWRLAQEDDEPEDESDAPCPCGEPDCSRPTSHPR
jgi:hypothetical protein